jgi:hypothetical protein
MGSSGKMLQETTFVVSMDCSAGATKNLVPMRRKRGNGREKLCLLTSVERKVNIGRFLI